MAVTSSSVLWRFRMLAGLWRGLTQSFPPVCPPSRYLPPFALEGLFHPSCTPQPDSASGEPSGPLEGDAVVLFAAPKGRTSHSRKRKRMTHKWLKNIDNYTICSSCGNARLLHVLCGYCLRKTLMETAQFRRQQRDQQE